MTSESDWFEAAARLQRAGRLAEAAQQYRRIVAHNPRHALAWHQLGCIAFHARRYEAAFEDLSRAIRLDGAQARFHHNLGTCCRALGQLAEAQASYQQAIRLAPDDLVTRTHLCLTLYAREDRAAAERCADDALRRPRRTAEEHAACATLLLLRGELAEGFAEHEWRLEIVPQRPQAARATRWDGNPRPGQTILVHAEQGLGDTLQWLRYVPLLARRGMRPVLALQKNLLPLVAEAGPCELVPLDEPWPPFDAHVAMFSLPWAFRAARDSIVAEVPYLRARPRLVDAWKARLAAWSGFRVGIQWQGTATFEFDRTRSIPLAQYAPLARVAGVRLFALQKGVGSEQVTALGGGFESVDLGPELDVTEGAFMDTAAVMENLDLVVTSDTAIAHLAGALGVPVWVALSTMPDCRWMLDRTDSPWYPTMRLFRQQRIGQWTEVFERIAGELAARVAAGGRPRTPG